jgi:hypothetical protein
MRARRRPRTTRRSAAHPKTHHALFWMARPTVRRLPFGVRCALHAEQGRPASAAPGYPGLRPGYSAGPSEVSDFKICFPRVTGEPGWDRTNDHLIKRGVALGACRTLTMCGRRSPALRLAHPGRYFSKSQKAARLRSPFTSKPVGRCRSLAGPAVAPVAMLHAQMSSVW